MASIWAAPRPRSWRWTTSGGEALRRRIATARDYAGTVAAIAGLVRGRRKPNWAQRGSVGMAIPGTVSRQTGLIKNANTTWLNGKPFAARSGSGAGPAGAAGQ